MALRQRRLSAPTRILVREAAQEWLEAARGGVVRTRSGRPYKPSTLRTYAAALDNRVLPVLGHLRLSAVTRRSVQDLIDDLVRAGLSASTTHNMLMPLRAVYRRAVSRGDVAANPTLGLSLPVGTGRRERVARPEEADALIAALPERDRALWATALYAGLRRGELQALRWSRVDLDAGIIRVTNGWDREAGLIEPKSRAASRRVPLPAALRPHLVSQRLRQRAADGGFVFAAAGVTPFDPPTIARRAKRAWLAAGLEPINLHECRHTFAAHMVAAGVNVKALSSYLGHSSISTTLDRYGHLLPGTSARPPRCSTPTSTAVSARRRQVEGPRSSEPESRVSDQLSDYRTPPPAASYPPYVSTAAEARRRDLAEAIAWALFGDLPGSAAVIWQTTRTPITDRFRTTTWPTTEDYPRSAWGSALRSAENSFRSSLAARSLLTTAGRHSGQESDSAARCRDRCGAAQRRLGSQGRGHLGSLASHGSAGKAALGDGRVPANR